MSDTNRRAFLRSVATATGATAAMTTFPEAIAKALSIPAHQRTGTIEDVEHIVILMQENRAFDHYFGTLNGVRGFGERFPLPVANATGIVNRTVWVQPNTESQQLPGRPPTGGPPAIAPFRLNTVQNFGVMRVSGTPHSWTDAQAAWDNGRMNRWTVSKNNHSLGYFTAEDIPFQFALANAFTLCDHYHCATQTGTNTNRLFQWTANNDPLGLAGGPSTDNSHDSFNSNTATDYTWTTYPERLQARGISWQVYQNMADNFTDNPLAGFRPFRDAYYNRPGFSAELKARGITTRDLDLLRADVVAGRLPQVSWIVATAEGSEHPGPSSPAQGADYTSRVLEALTANPDVWSKTVLFVNFDENDGFFDHMPPPAAPSYTSWNADPALAQLAGGSTVSTVGEYHEKQTGANPTSAYLHQPYGLGPRVPMYVVSPWSKGGWVNSQVFDHGSTLRFIEARFGVMETGITPWRRAVCGDMTSAFNFANPNDDAFFSQLPATLALANRARALTSTTTPATPSTLALPSQAVGARPSRALPYELNVSARVLASARLATPAVELGFGNTGLQGAVLHVYDRKNLAALPRRYTAGAGSSIAGQWLADAAGLYDLWVLGPNGFHRHFTGNARRAVGAGQPNPEVLVEYDTLVGDLVVHLRNSGSGAATMSLVANAYVAATPMSYVVLPRSEQIVRLPLAASSRWYDFSVKVAGQPEYSRRFAGRMENGEHGISDPALGGAAVATQLVVG
jgi:phospholipase C